MSRTFRHNDPNTLRANRSFKALVQAHGAYDISDDDGIVLKHRGAKIDVINENDRHGDHISKEASRQVYGIGYHNHSISVYRPSLSVHRARLRSQNGRDKLSAIITNDFTHQNTRYRWSDLKSRV